jgi:hypothetical protein
LIGSAIAETSLAFAPLWGLEAKGDIRMIQPSEIREHMDVEGSDGGHVGRVDKLIGDEIELTKFDLSSGLRRHTIPMSWVEMVDGDTVRLNMTRDAAKAAWKTKH